MVAVLFTVLSLGAVGVGAVNLPVSVVVAPVGAELRCADRVAYALGVEAVDETIEVVVDAIGAIFERARRGADAVGVCAVGVTIPVAGITFVAAAPLGLEPIGGWEKTDVYGDRRSRKDCIKRAKERERGGKG